MAKSRMIYLKPEVKLNEYVQKSSFETGKAYPLFAVSGGRLILENPDTGELFDFYPSNCSTIIPA